MTDLSFNCIYFSHELYIQGDKIGLSMKVINQTTGKDEDAENVQLR